MARDLRIGWIGTGIMGAAMAGRLLKKGCQLNVYNRTPEKAAPLISSGAVWRANPGDVAKNSDIVFTMLSFPRDVEEIILGENGVLEGISSGGIICDMSTSSPDLARNMATRATAKNVDVLDAPVTGGDVGAQNGTLSIFVGGGENAFGILRTYLETLGREIMYCGDAGSGQLAKLANQVNVAGVTFGVCESLLFAQQAGLDVERWLELVVNGSGGSVSMNTRGRRLLKGDLEPGFIVDHFVKDLGLCLDECRRMGIILPCTAMAEEFFRIMQARGGGRLGTQALICCLAELSGKKWHKCV